MERELRADNYERAANLAAAMLRDDVSLRGDAWSLAVTGYVSSMIELGRSADVVDFFETLRPGIATPGYELDSFKDFLMQFAMIHALVESGDLDRSEAVLIPLEAAADAAFPRWRDDAGILAWIALMMGETADASRLALTDLSASFADQLDYELMYRHTAWLRRLSADPDIAERLAELDEEKLAAAEDVRATLNERMVSANQ